jgi:DNA mismatch repair ATPase MutL
MEEGMNAHARFKALALPALTLALALSGAPRAHAGAYDQLQSLGNAGAVPEVNGPVCVANCGGQQQPAARKTQQQYEERETRQQQTYSPAPRVVHHHKPSATQTAVYKGLKDSLNNMSTVNPQALQQMHQKQLQNAQHLQEAQQLQQQDEEARRNKAAHDALLEKSRLARDLAGNLQGMPGASGDLSGLVPGLPASQQPLNTDLEALRAGAGSGFDTGGKFMVKQAPAQPPKVSAPTPEPLTAAQQRELKLQKLAAEGKLSDSMRDMLKERDATRAKKQELQQELDGLYSKGKLSPDETVKAVNLQQDISTAQNKENYYGYSIDQELGQVR